MEARILVSEAIKTSALQESNLWHSSNKRQKPTRINKDRPYIKSHMVFFRSKRMRKTTGI